jgi:MoaA/NifB/PqqE/SkfB family radical SAM enzyme
MEGDEAQHDRVVGRPGSWRKTIAGVRHLVRLRREAGKSFPKFNLKLAVTRDTAHGLVDFVRLAADLGVDIVNFLAEHDLVEHAGNLTGHTARSRMDVAQRKPEGVDPDQLREQLRAAFEAAQSAGLEVRLTPHLPIEEFVRHYTDDRTLDPAEYECGSAWSRLGLGADGRYSSGACNYLRCGDVRQDSMWDVWNNEETRALRADILKSKVFAGCNGCCNLKYVGPRKFGLAGVDA